MPTIKLNVYIKINLNFNWFGGLNSGVKSKPVMANMLTDSVIKINQCLANNWINGTVVG